MKVMFRNLISGQHGTAEIVNDRIVQDSIQVIDNGDGSNYLGGDILDFLGVEVFFPEMSYLALQDICGSAENGRCACSFSCSHRGWVLELKKAA